MVEGTEGLRRVCCRATVFPCPMSLGSTWNETLVNTIGTVVAHEALAKHWGDHSNALGFFAPNINIVHLGPY